MAEITKMSEPLAGPISNTDQPDRSQPIRPGIISSADGRLRWVYEMNMWQNPTLILTIWKVLLLAAFVPALFVFFLSLEDGTAAAFFTFGKIAGITAGAVTGLMLLAYPIVALINGGKYCVVFEMDETHVKHIQMQKQFKKSQVLSMIVLFGAAMSGNLQAAAAGILAGSKQSTVSSFAKVQSIVVNEKRNTIYLNEKMVHNQVYADSDNFAFVRDAIISRCEKARVIYK